MKHLRTIVVDDEPLAREGLRNLLLAQKDIEIIAECGDAFMAVEQIIEQKPDLVFLDIQMPEMDGFEVLRQIKDECTTAIIFITAFDNFAIKAFEVHALDYLLKPVVPERFITALERAREFYSKESDNVFLDRFRNLLHDVDKQAPKRDRFAIRVGTSFLFLKNDDIDWVEAEGDYVTFHTREKKYLVRGSIGSFEDRLPSQQFLRIHRSVIVNINRIKELVPLFSGEYSVLLQGGTKLRLSRSYKDNLKLLLDRFS